MSMKRFARGAARILQELTSRTRILPRIFKPSYKLDVYVRQATLRKTANPFRLMIRSISRNNRAFVRPFVALYYHRGFLAEQSRGGRFGKFAFKNRLKSQGVIERVRDIFGTNVRYNPALEEEQLPEGLSHYDIDENIGYGCNAAVYAARLRSQVVRAISVGYSGDPGLALVPTSTSRLPNQQQQNGRKFNLAVKLMYNYDLDAALGEDHLWKSMGSELVPLPGAHTKLRGRIVDFRSLPSFHPNVVKVLTAFTDVVPILPDARERYPEAVPSPVCHGFGDMGMGAEQKTLFVVMKRYKMTLRDYLLTQEKRDFFKAHVMFAQLLEGVLFLYNNKVAQRDMKSDNILLEFDHPDEVPRLVISDFGCALSTGDWTVHYRDSFMDLGGNLATRAPEIINAKPGPSSVVDFSMADTWAAGTLAHEIYSRVNPFYSMMKSATYKEEDVPDLHPRAHYVVRHVVTEMLRRDPKQRVNPVVAANAVALSLFRTGENMRNFLKQVGIFDMNIHSLRNAASSALKNLGEKTLDDLLLLLTAETIVSRLNKLSKAEIQLRATFLSRVERGELLPAVNFFLFPEESN